MKKKIGIVCIVIIIITELILLVKGYTPKKQIAILSSSIYFKIHCPRWKFEYIDMEWAPQFGDYIIYYKYDNKERQGICIGPKEFPIFLGQGIDGIIEEYCDTYQK